MPTKSIISAIVIISLFATAPAFGANEPSPAGEVLAEKPKDDVERRAVLSAFSGPVGQHAFGAAVTLLIVLPLFDARFRIGLGDRVSLDGHALLFPGFALGEVGARLHLFQNDVASLAFRMSGSIGIAPINAADPSALGYAAFGGLIGSVRIGNMIWTMSGSESFVSGNGQQVGLHATTFDATLGVEVPAVTGVNLFIEGRVLAETGDGAGFIPFLTLGGSF